MSSALGGSSKSSNSNNSTLKSSLSSLLDTGSQAATSLGDLLSGDTSGFETYKDSTGLASSIQEGSRGITGNAAAGGLLRSGSSSKALTNYSNNQQNESYNDYVDNLTSAAGLGTSAGSVLSSSGQKSSSKSGLFSDRRLKESVRKIGELANGLGVYVYRYLGQTKEHIGVMAQEVAILQPEALGPVRDGYMTVDYGRINYA